MSTETLYEFRHTGGDYKVRMLRSDVNKRILDLAEESLNSNTNFTIVNFSPGKSAAGYIGGYNILAESGYDAYIAEVIPQYAVKRRKFFAYDATTLSDYTTSLQRAIQDLTELIISEIETMIKAGGEIKIKAILNAINIGHNAESIEMYIADENDYNIDGNSVYGKIVNEVLRKYEGIVLPR